AVCFVLLFISLSVLQWVLFVQQLGVHYTLHFTPWIVLAVSVCFWNIRCFPNPYLRALSFLVGGAVFVLNMVIGLAPGIAPHLNMTTIQPVIAESKFFALPLDPLQHPNYTEIVRLIDYLRATAAP